MSDILKTIKVQVILLWLLAGVGMVPALTAEWQWSVTIPEVISLETKASPHAFLRIPPTCKQVQG
jgi:hypothetical protein